MPTTSFIYYKMQALYVARRFRHQALLSIAMPANHDPLIVVRLIDTSIMGMHFVVMPKLIH